MKSITQRHSGGSGPLPSEPSALKFVSESFIAASSVAAVPRRWRGAGAAAEPEVPADVLASIENYIVLRRCWSQTRMKIDLAAYVV